MTNLNENKQIVKIKIICVMVVIFVYIIMNQYFKLQIKMKKK
jgi:hypothetical protein